MSETERDAMTSAIVTTFRELYPHSGVSLPEIMLAALLQDARRLRSLPGGEPAPFARPVSARYDKDHEEWDLCDADNDRLFSIKSWDGGEAIVQYIARAINAYASGARVPVTESGERMEGAPSE